MKPAEEKKYKILVIDDTKYTTLLNKKFEKRKDWAEPDPKKIKSIIPGTVVEIFVAAKQQVKMGEVLMIHEAMKMKNRILSPMDGTIRTIHVKIGEVIPKGALMLEFI
jgi:biotin carboxyl carrier protein